MKFMRLKRVSILTALVTALGAGIAVPSAMAQSGGVVVRKAPPSARAEARGRSRAGYEWASGYWRWDGRQYAWVSGHWQRARAGYVWEPGRWDRRRDGWVFIPGRWARAGRPGYTPPASPVDDRPDYDRDRDRDGDRYDRERDGDRDGHRHDRDRHGDRYDRDRHRDGRGRGAHRWRHTGRYQAGWRRQGWFVLGESWVGGRGLETDEIRIGRRAGRYRQLMLVVDDDDLEMDDILITYDSGRTWSPTVQQYFREGARSRILSLPNGPRGVRSVKLRYRNVPGRGPASVQVWGR